MLVDDEMPVLRSLQRTLQRLNFGVFIADSGQAALDLLARQQVDIVISDMRMPYMNGHQFLRKVKEIHPSTTRLILSGYADEKEITKTLLDGSSKMYILKPWDSQQLQQTIRQLLDVRKRLSNCNLLETINEIEGLCALPRIYNKLMELIDQDADVTQIAAVIEEDPAIAAQILHIANSAFYGIKTGSVSQAVIYLGMTAVKSIVLSTNLCELKGTRRFKLLDMDLLWRHAGATNQLAGELYRKITGRHIPATASTVGLLHDIGKMALLGQFSDKLAKMDAALITRPEASLAELEIEFMGVSHQDVGGYLLEWWDLPHQIVESALFHHDPFNECVNDRQMVSIVHVASHYAGRQIFKDFAGSLDERTFGYLQITREECEQLIQK